MIVKEINIIKENWQGLLGEDRKYVLKAVFHSPLNL